ncbi:hypothetical protein BKA67DRAFT_249787 [Truncatella angustata]|uniref:Uncharacterized protein n=1 Tax=Truncatella angustata TaxID=152316 RepID=A0A9P8UP68_9PEZI|nr:uncharacterized protein BKA67DRAFT_249787 [Truncatella angustata]KAH6655802.1 hypothetical protein BKA67DRAFT_249787 [Truncatella angustata]
MDNNCPTMSLLNPARSVDIILNIDASSDVQKDSFQQRVSQIGFRRRLDLWRRKDIRAGNDLADPDRFKGLYTQIYDCVLIERPETVVDSYKRLIRNPPAAITNQECTMNTYHYYPISMQLRAMIPAPLSSLALTTLSELRSK